MTKNRGQLKVFDARQLPVRISLIFAVLCVLSFGWLTIRMQLGNMLAELASPSDQNAEELAQLAVRLAPGDPLSNWLLADLTKDSKSGNSSTAEKDFETVVKLSPNDFRWWIELGRAREQAENIEDAEKAFVKAVNLAPNYAFPHWQLGNFYMRQNRSDEAFVELKKAAETSAIYRDQVLSMAWDFFNQDASKLEQIAGDSTTVKAGLAKFYATKERAEDSLRVWDTLSEEDKQSNSDAAKVIAQALFDKRFYRQAIEFIRQLGIEPDAQNQTIQNAGFEKPIGDIKEVYFGWRVSPAEKMEIKLDPTQKFEGNRSLRVTFNGYINPSLYNIYQIVTVEPSARYRLSFRLRTENLKSGGAPQLEIYNAKDDKNIVTSSSYPIGTNDWQQIKVDFTAPQSADAVVIRTIRAFCGSDCPIVGTFWYDDFKLDKLKQ
jgi:cytochrome c-type biogenesis protein CcmH/NrfG